MTDEETLRELQHKLEDLELQAGSMVSLLPTYSPASIELLMRGLQRKYEAVQASYDKYVGIDSPYTDEVYTGPKLIVDNT